jgi:hypothetical protein
MSTKRNLLFAIYTEYSSGKDCYQILTCHIHVPWHPAQLTITRPIVHYTSDTRGILMRITTMGATQI